MYEVEIKVRADHESVRDRLTELDAEIRRTVTQVDTYYDAPARDFAETDEALRVRREREEDDERTLLTYKGPLVDSASKSREEAETGIEDSDAIRDILDGLGYDPAATVRKERDEYHVDGCTVTLDSVDGLGEFVEVEVSRAVDDREGVDSARGVAVGVLESLGLDPDEQIQTSYLGLLLES